MTRRTAAEHEREIEAPGGDPQEADFGEFLVEEGALNRAELEEALREQREQPGVRLGEVIAWLGYLPYPEVDRLLTEWSSPAAESIVGRMPRVRRLRSTLACGEYEIVGRLAQGGMAEVWHAIGGGSAAREPVAVKTIRAEHAHDPRVVELFLREAAIALRLRHPGIVHVSDFGMDAGHPFMVMEYLSGATLRDVLGLLGARGQVPPTWFVAGVMERVCDALQYMHDQPDGLIHNDISPENIMVTFGGAVKLLDLGSATPAGTPVLDQKHVRKYSYLPPELIHGRELDRRSDVYSLGVTLYEMTVGTRPFASDPRIGLAAIVEGRVVDPRVIDPDLPDALVQVIRTAIAREPSARYPEARLLGQDLRRLPDRAGGGADDLGTYLGSLFSGCASDAALV